MNRRTKIGLFCTFLLLLTAIVSTVALMKCRDKKHSLEKEVDLIELKTVDEEFVEILNEEIEVNKDGVHCDRAYDDAIQYLATKTPYLSKNVDDEQITPPGCTAVEIWILGRHGTRWPNTKDILNMQTKLPAIKNLIGSEKNATLCHPELNSILNWAPNPHINLLEKGNLVEQGYKEWREISHRFQKRFPQLFPSTFNNESYYFRASVQQRAQDSGKAFVEAIFGQALPALSTVFAPPIEGDPLLYFYKTCKKWIKEVDKNPQVKYETEKFERSPVFQKVIKTVSNRLGIGRNLSSDEILIMYTTCSFETAWNPTVQSPWCAVFSKADFEVLEYHEDLENFWTDGYAFPVTFQQACTPISDVINTFSSKIENNNESENPSHRLTTAYFAHRETISKLYTRLGLFRDSGNLTSETFTEFGRNSRQWVSSKIAKFASNIAFVLFNCTESEVPHGDAGAHAGEKTLSVFKIGTLVQEEKTKLPACGGKWLCPFSEFYENFRDIVNTCDLAKICKIEKSS